MSYRNRLPSLFRGLGIEDSWGKFFNETEFLPAADLEETDTGYKVSVDLPGLKKDDLKVELRDRQLWISGERKEHRESEDKTKGRYESERYYGSFCRSFTLPTNVEADKVEARFENGVLDLLIPKSAAAEVKQITVKAKEEKAA